MYMYACVFVSHDCQFIILQKNKYKRTQVYEIMTICAYNFIVNISDVLEAASHTVSYLLVSLVRPTLHESRVFQFHSQHYQLF